ncbi:MAG TPA: histidine phosphatase family protein [Herpetosiphonaceae bacterium]|nr:histidine phosphatase family protein [Herpetosiphonaceae bacterium]
MRLVLIRHGESRHATQALIAGPGHCPGLTEGGRRQAERLAVRLGSSGELGDCQRLLSSPVLRARQTADILRAALGWPAVEDDPRLAEIDPGAANGLTWAAYRQHYGEFDLISEPRRPFAPGGESWDEFLGRVEQTLAELAERCAGQTVVAVSHAGFIVAALLMLFAIPRPGTGARIDPGHASLTRWRHEDGSWHLEAFNDQAHLVGPG